MLHSVLLNYYKTAGGSVSRRSRGSGLQYMRRGSDSVQGCGCVEVHVVKDMWRVMLEV